MLHRTLVGCGLIPLVIPSGIPEFPSIRLPFDNSMDPGYGIGSATGDVRSPKCIKSIKTIKDDPTGDTIRLTFRGVSDTKTMHEMLDVSAGGSWAGFGVHVSTHAEYATSQTLSSYEAAYVLKIEVDKSAPWRLDPSSEWDESLNGRPGLDNLCGDSFIERFSTGGRFFAVFRVDKRSFDNMDGTSVNFKGDGWGGAIEAAVKKSVESSTSSGEINVDLLQIGGNGHDWVRAQAPLTIDVLLNKATTFPGDVDLHPVPFEAVVIPWSSYFPSYSPPSVMDVENAKNLMKELMNDFQYLTEILHSVNWIETHPHDFDVSQSCLQQTSKAAQQAKDAVQSAYNEISSNYAAKPTMPSLPDASCLPDAPKRPLCTLSHYYSSTVTGDNFVCNAVTYRTCRSDNLNRVYSIDEDGMTVRNTNNPTKIGHFNSDCSVVTWPSGGQWTVVKGCLLSHQYFSVDTTFNCIPLTSSTCRSDYSSWVYSIDGDHKTMHNTVTGDVGQFNTACTKVIWENGGIWDVVGPAALSSLLPQAKNVLSLSAVNHPYELL